MQSLNIFLITAQIHKMILMQLAQTQFENYIPNNSGMDKKDKNGSSKLALDNKNLLMKPKYKK